MATIRWTEDRGWHDARIEPYGPITLDPAAQVFHYGQEIFEGLKAYAQPDGTVAAFRPQSNSARFNRSAARLAMPELPESLFVRSLELLVAQDRQWVPSADGHSLYLRPFMIATQVGLGVNRPSSSYLYAVIASPVSGYFGGEVRPVTVWLSEDYSRAAPGGTGRGQVRRQLRGRLRWPAAGPRPRLRSGGLARCRGTHLGRGNGRDEPVLRLRLWRGCADRHPGHDRHAAARHDQGLAAQARPDLGSRLSEDRISVPDWQRGCAVGRDHRGLRVRHRRGDHPGGQCPRPERDSGPSATAPPAR